MNRLHREAAVRMLALATAALVSVHCSTATTPSDPAPRPGVDETRQAAPATDAPWHQVPLERVRVTAERSKEDRTNQTVAIWGDVAVWNGDTQFYLTRAEMRQILEAFDRANFQAIPTVSGGGKLLGRRAGIVAGTYRKESAQTLESAENPVLKTLVESIFSVVEPLVEEHGTTTGSLSEGLRRIAAGEIAPELLDLLLHVRPREGDPREGFVIRVYGGEVELRRYVGGVLTEPVVLELSEESVRQFAARVTQFDVEPMPINLFDEDYTELTVEVLGHEKKILARPFANFPRDRHGELQVRFEHLTVWLESMKDRWFLMAAESR